MYENDKRTFNNCILFPHFLVHFSIVTHFGEINFFNVKCLANSSSWASACNMREKTINVKWE